MYRDQEHQSDKLSIGEVPCCVSILVTAAPKTSIHAVFGRSFLLSVGRRSILLVDTVKLLRVGKQKNLGMLSCVRHVTACSRATAEDTKCGEAHA